MTFDDIPDFLLAPFAGAPDDAWQNGPPGRWSPGEIVAHVATAIGTSAKGLASRLDKPAMRRRPRSPAQFLAWQWVRTTGYFGWRRTAPEATRPEQRPDRAATEARLRENVRQFRETANRLLPARADDLFLKHPVFGDLKIEEWFRFHVVHAAHHRRQLVRRIGYRQSTAGS